MHSPAHNETANLPRYAEHNVMAGGPQYADPDVARDLLGLFVEYDRPGVLALAVHAALWGGIPPLPFKRDTLRYMDRCPGVLTLNRGLGWSFVMYDRGDAMDIGPIYRGPARRYIEASIRA